MTCEPLRGRRHVEVSEPRNRRQYAGCVRDLVDVHHPDAVSIRQVQSDLNPHDGASRYGGYPPAEARRILNRLESHHTGGGPWPRAKKFAD
jgi:hypothetical protein